MNIRNFKIKVRLTIAFAAITLIMFLSAGYTITQINKIKTKNSELFHKNLLAEDYLLEADRDAYQSRLAISQSITSQLKVDLEKNKKDILENLEQLNTRYTKYAEIYKVSTNPLFIKQDSIFQANYIQLLANTDNLINLIDKGNISQAGYIYNNQYSQCFDAMREALNQSTEILMNSAETDHNIIIDIGSSIILVIIVLSAFFILLIITISISVTKSISNPLALLVVEIKKIEQGYLNINTKSNAKDELAQLANSINSMVHKFKGTIGAVKESIRNIKEGSLQISDNSQLIAQGANEQAASSEQISQSIEELVATINQNTIGARQTEKTANKAEKGVIEGQDATNNTLNMMLTIAEKISIITNIAQKTDILAINASIEASRAGESGRGFAVVAQEIRKLAENSQKAANQIVELVNSSVAIAKNSGEMLSQTVPDVQLTAKLVQEIAAISQEQNLTAVQINQAIQQFNSVMQQNSSTSEEMSTSSEELAAQSESLQDAISYFKI
jgi:methyl-accepting chemotaxis protein